MATQNPFLGINSFPAAGDLSAAQYRFVDLDTAGRVAAVASAGGRAIGVLQNDPAALDEPATVATGLGMKLKVVAGDTVTAGDNLQSDNVGRAITASTGDHVLGVACQSGVVGQVIEILFGRSHLNA